MNIFFENIKNLLDYGCQHPYIAAVSIITVLAGTVGAYKYLKSSNTVYKDKLNDQTKDQIKDQLEEKFKIQNKFNQITYEKEQVLDCINKLEVFKGLCIEDEADMVSNLPLRSKTKVIENYAFWYSKNKQYSIANSEEYVTCDYLIDAFKCQLVYIEEALQFIEKEAISLGTNIKDELLVNYKDNYLPKKLNENSENNFVLSTNTKNDIKDLIKDTIEYAKEKNKEVEYTDAPIIYYKALKKISSNDVDIQNILNEDKNESDKYLCSDQVKNAIHSRDEIIKYLNHRIDIYNFIKEDVSIAERIKEEASNIQYYNAKLTDTARSLCKLKYYNSTNSKQIEKKNKEYKEIENEIFKSHDILEELSNKKIDSSNIIRKINEILIEYPIDNVEKHCKKYDCFYNKTHDLIEYDILQLKNEIYTDLLSLEEMEDVCLEEMIDDNFTDKHEEIADIEMEKVKELIEERKYYLDITKKNFNLFKKEMEIYTKDNENYLIYNQNKEIFIYKDTSNDITKIDNTSSLEEVSIEDNTLDDILTDFSNEITNNIENNKNKINNKYLNETLNSNNNIENILINSDCSEKNIIYVDLEEPNNNIFYKISIFIEELISVMIKIIIIIVS